MREVRTLIVDDTSVMRKIVERSQSQAATATHVTGDSTGRFSRLPAFQCFTDGRLARSTQDDSGAHRPCTHRIVHFGRVRRKA